MQTKTTEKAIEVENEIVDKPTAEDVRKTQELLRETDLFALVLFEAEEE